MYSHQWKKIQRLKRDHLFAQIRQKNYYDVGTKTTKYNIADRDIANRVDHSKSIGIFRILLMKCRKQQTKNKKLWCTLSKTLQSEEHANNRKKKRNANQSKKYRCSTTRTRKPKKQLNTDSIKILTEVVKINCTNKRRDESKNVKSQSMP